jgi:N-acetylglucosaminyldiphosphoundecaprenol N-acetyl-beta-D-mannosaminyltransferase
MTTLIHSPTRDCVSSLGIPVDNLTLDDTVEQIISMTRRRDGRVRLVSTLNVDFLVNSLGTRFSQPRHPELLNILRHSDLVTADGFPIVWLSRIMGRPLKQRVCGSDLVPALAERARAENMSLFLLGGGDGVALGAADELVQRNPGLRIAGTAAPYVHIEGPGLAESTRADRELVDSINASGADILLVGLGNPKQELWFNRNREALKVPVCIGVGGTFEFITGAVKRAPRWIQQLNLEWIYRISQDPARLWRRYVKGLFKLAALSAPLISRRLSEKLAFFRQRPEGPETIHWRKVWSAREEALSVLRLPPLVSRQYLEALTRQLCADSSGAGMRLLDFSRVHKVEMSGHQLLLTLAELQQSQGADIQMMAIPKRVRRDLAATRVLDALQAREGDALAALVNDNAQGSASELTCRSYVLDDCALTFLGGRVSARGLQSLGVIECLEHTARDRDCILDLRNVTLLESSAIVKLRPFFSSGGPEGGRVVFSGLNDTVLQMIGVAGLGEPQNCITDQMLMSVICDGGFGDGASGQA